MNNTSNYKYRKLRFRLRAIGGILIICAIVLAAIGFIDFFYSFREHGYPRLFFLSFIGIPLLPIGIVLLVLSFIKEASDFTKNEVIPQAKHVGNKIKESSAKQTADFVDKVKDYQTKNECPNCHTINNSDAKYCKQCGAQLNKKCPNCNTINDNNAKYCDMCGHRF